MPNPTTRPDTRVIGIDCATDAKNVGLALCTIRDGQPQIEQVSTGTSWPAVDEQVASWATTPTLLALDAPLGWPAPLGESLHTHRAGDAFATTPNAMFRRATDDAIAKRLSKRPLDVGADRIARTAHAALSFLARLSKLLDTSIPLAWHPRPITGITAIEVYPAGTLTARNLPNSGYKGSKAPATKLREQLTTAIRNELSFDQQAHERMVHTDHALDAVLCVCAGLDFLSGEAVAPDDLSLAKREGWIWVRTRRPPRI